MSDIRITHAVVSMLESVKYDNDHGISPTKIDTVAAGTAYPSGYRMPGRSRANRYTLLDKMLGAGLLENASEGSAYALRVTDKGAEVLAEMAA